MRPEFDNVIDILNARGEILKEYRAALDNHGAGLDQLRRDLDVKFKRIAQLQEEVDRLKREKS